MHLSRPWWPADTMISCWESYRTPGPPRPTDANRKDRIVDPTAVLLKAAAGDVRLPPHFIIILDWNNIRGVRESHVPALLPSDCRPELRTCRRPSRAGYPRTAPFRVQT